MKKRVFLVACSGRSGSTLLQRLLMTHPDLFMWGEGDHICRHFMQMRELFGFAELQSSTSSWRAMHNNGTVRGWYPLLLPIRPLETFHLQIAKWIDELLVNPYDPDKSWGCKFVVLVPRYVKMMYELFPDAAFIFLERSWHQVWASMRKVSGWFPEQKPGARYQRWGEMMAFFRDPGFPALRVTYSQLIRQPTIEVARIEEHLDMEAGSLDMAVFDHKVKGW